MEPNTRGRNKEQAMFSAKRPVSRHARAYEFYDRDSLCTTLRYCRSTIKIRRYNMLGRDTGCMKEGGSPDLRRVLAPGGRISIYTRACTRP